MVREVAEKSIGAEETFGTDVDDPQVVLRELLRLSERTARRLRRAGMSGRTVALKVRFADFTTITRSRTLPQTTDVAREVYATARGLYEALHLERARIRLVGVRVEGLVEAGGQHRQLMLDERPQGWREAEQAGDRAVARFGVAQRPPGLAARSRRRSPSAPDTAPGRSARGRRRTARGLTGRP